jgi:hypothetical protein
MLPNAPAKDPAAAPPAAETVASWGPRRPVGAGPVHCAKAPEEFVETAIAKAIPAKIRPLRAFNLTFMKQPQKIAISGKFQLRL